MTPYHRLPNVPGGANRNPSVRHPVRPANGQEVAQTVAATRLRLPRINRIRRVGYAARAGV